FANNTSNNLVQSIGGQVIFHGLNAGSIIMNGNTTVHTQTPAIVLSSLDLTDQSVIDYIFSAQQSGLLGGNIKAATPTLTIRPENIPSSGLSAFLIPQGSIVTGTRFTATRTITVNAPVDIEGSFNYDNNSSLAVILTSQPMTVGSQGLLSTAAGGITLNVPSLLNLGNISATGGGI